jgi:hypothetical protein
LESLLPRTNNTKYAAVTDCKLKETIIRYDTAKFGDYLHGLLLGTMSNTHTQQLIEALAWYFTFGLTESFKYARPMYPQWVDHLYLFPVKKLAQIVGHGFLKDFALGRAAIQEDILPDDIQELFLPEELFYTKKKRYYRS